jgi:hypothetical protein
VNLVLYGLSSSAHVWKRPLDFEKASIGFSVATSIFITMMKLCCVYLNRERFNTILSKLKLEFSHEECEQNGFFQTKAFFNRFAKTYSFFLFSSLIFLLKLLISGFMESDSNELPVDYYFPFDAKNQLIYPFVFLWILTSHILFLANSIYTEIFIYGLIVYVSMEFKALATKFKDFQNIVNENDIEKLMNDYVDRHNTISEVSNEIQTILSSSFSACFTFTSFVICLTAFQASTAIEPVKFFFGGMYCLISMNVIFMQCFFGQMLYDASSKIFDDITECGYENWQSQKLKKNLIILLRRAQNPAHLTIYKISTITLEQYRTVSEKAERGFHCLIYILIIYFRFLQQLILTSHFVDACMESLSNICSHENDESFLCNLEKLNINLIIPLLSVKSHS